MCVIGWRGGRCRTGGVVHARRSRGTSQTIDGDQRKNGAAIPFYLGISRRSEFKDSPGRLGKRSRNTLTQITKVPAPVVSNFAAFTW